MGRNFLRRVCTYGCVLTSIGLSGCGGGSPSNGSSPTGAGPSAQTEFLYTRDEFGDLLAFQIDLSTGRLTAIQTVNPPPAQNTVGGGPLVPDLQSRFMYAYQTYFDGTVTHYSIAGYALAADGTLSLINGSPFAIPNPSSSGPPDFGPLVINSAGTVLYAVNDGSWGGVAGFRIDSSSGALTPMANTFSTGPYGATWAAIDPNGQFLYLAQANTATPSGGPGIGEFGIDASTGSLTALAQSPALLSASSLDSPGGLVFDPNGQFLYVNLPGSESSNDIAGFLRNPTTGELTQMPGSPFVSESAANPVASSLAMHPSGKFLYVENYNGGAVSAFAVDPSSGFLSPVAGSPFPPQFSNRNTSPPTIVEGNAMAVDPSGKYLYLAGNDVEIVIYSINQTTGALKAVSGSPFPISGSPMSLTIIQGAGTL
jgi:6-phosphogluconolactonase